MSRGRRYNNEPKLNIKKVIAVIVAIAVIVMFVIAIKKLLNSDSSSNQLVSTSYFLINKDNKWGVIDNNSKIVIEPTYDETIVIPDNKKDVFIINYDVDYDNNTYKTKVLNAKGKEILTGYDNIKALENYDENKNLWYEENVLLIQKDGKYGLINFNGDVILNAEYDDIYALNGAKNSIVTVKDKQLGLVNDLGKKIINNEFEEIKYLGDNSKAYVVKKDGKYGVNEILDCKYQDIKIIDNKDAFCVKEDGKYKVINAEEKQVLNEKFDSIEDIKDGIIVYKYKNEFLAYNYNTEKKINKAYKELRYTSDNMFIAKIDNSYGIIDIDGETKLEAKYAKINYYEDVNIYELENNEDLNTILDKNLKEIAIGIVNDTNYDKSYIKVWTEEGYRYYKLNGDEKKESEILTQNNLFLSKQNGKYGFVDKDGKVVVDYIYDDAREQNNFGYIAIKKNGLWGSLDKKGNVICEPKYNLDENLLIDFIGEYHLGKDLNLMFYTNK